MEYINLMRDVVAGVPEGATRINAAGFSGRAGVVKFLVLGDECTEEAPNYLKKN